MWRSKKLYLFSLPFICFCALLGLSKNANAETINLDTNRLRGLVKLYGATDYGWTQELRYNEAVPGVKQSRAWDFYTAPFTSSGTEMVVSFTTEIAFTDNAPYANPWVNTDYMHVLYCYWGQNRVDIVRESMIYGGSTISYPVANSNITRTTSKWMGNVALTGIPKNTTERLKCAAGSYDYAYMSADSVTGMVDGNYMFTSNTGQIIMTDDSTNILIQQQIAQTEQLINIEAQIARQIAENQIKIDQLNQQIIQTQQNIQAIEDALTNPNVNGNFNTPPIQPFGPIGTITNSLLELPRIILDVNSCSPLTPELPYIHENIEIPCPSTILNGMAGGFMTFLDTITSAGIWFILARYIFRKVQKLRDPENTDEEYLDI